MDGDFPPFHRCAGAGQGRSPPPHGRAAEPPRGSAGAEGPPGGSGWKSEIPGPGAALGDAEASAVPARAGGCPGLARGGMRGRHRGLRWRLFPEQSGFWAETRASERTRLKVKSFGCRYPLFGRSLRLLGCCIKS